jgi:hypothetical protein
MQVKFVLLLSITLAVACCGCCSVPEKNSMASAVSDDLPDEALRTYVCYLRTINAGNKQPGTEIPPACWTDRIKALQPFKVYVHRDNIVVVQEFADGTEKGKYIYIPTSSHRPQSGDDGFEFAVVTEKGNVYCFERKMSRFE